MMNTQKLKDEAFKEIEGNRDQIIGLGRSVFNEPEEGFREHKTAKKVEKFFQDWGIRTQSRLAVTGVKGYLEGTSEGPCIALLGELDALFNQDHPKADKETGLVHACGHFAQLAGLVGAGFGLKKVMDKLPGKVILFAVPAEEFVNLEFRQKLKEKGEIKYFGGKQELVRLGAMDDVDLVVMQHAQSDIPGKSAFISSAGVAPFKGINALNAFHVALAAIHAQRETFRDEDAVRVHMIVTKGGDAVNVVPGEVRVEMYVRAKTIDAIKAINAKVDRALRAGAMGIGAKVEITNTAGYLPILSDERLTKCWLKNAETILGDENVHYVEAWGGSTDMGDLTHLMPGIHPFVGSFSGDLHSKDFEPTDEEMAFITSSKILAATVIDLLANDAQTAREVINNFKPRLGKQEYLNILDSLSYQQLWEPD